MDPKDQAQTPAAQAAATDAPAAESGETEKKPATLKQRMEGLLSRNSTLVQERDAATTRADEAEANVLAAEHERDQMKARAEKAEASLAKETATRQAAEQEVAQLKGEAKTASEQADEQVAAAGFPANNLPAASEKAAGESRADLEARLKDEQDPKERFRIAQMLSPLNESARN